MAKPSISDWAQYIADVSTALSRLSTLEESQRQLSEAVKEIGFRIRDLEGDLKVLKSEVKLDALKETQSVVNSVQGNLNDRIERLRCDFVRLPKKAS